MRKYFPQSYILERMYIPTLSPKESKPKRKVKMNFFQVEIEQEEVVSEEEEEVEENLILEKLLVLSLS